jgi:phosphinothricin acetyltransferase
MTKARARTAEPADLEPLRQIYNHYVESTAITFDIGARTLEERREWMSHYAETGPHRLLVADVGGVVAGYASSSAHRPKAAYDTSVEVTIYLAPDRTRGGLGTLLYTALLDALEAEDVHCAYAGMTLPNLASEALHRRFGFSEIGVFHEVGRKLGRYWDVRWFEKRLR